MTINYFKDSLDFEQKCRGRLDSIYMTYFGELKNIEVIKDRQLQFKGHDIHLIYEDKKWIIDEKVRRRDYSDILIEYLSNKQTGRKGWIYDNESDFLAYLFPTFGFWLLDTQKIKSWVLNKESDFWRHGYKDISAENENQNNEKYTTLSKAIPFRDLENLNFVFYKLLDIRGCF